MPKSSVEIIFFGTADFAVPVLEALVGTGHDIVAVITAPDKPVGRKQILTPPPIKVAAQKLGLPILQPNSLKDPEFLNSLKPKTYNLKPNLGVVASYGKLIPPEIFNLPKHGTLNIHPSLLPKYRGPSPIQTAILNGDMETGITIMKVDEEMDHGDIVAAISYQLSAISSYKEVHDKLAQSGAELLIKTLPDYLAGKIKPVPQDHSKATFTKKFITKDGEIKLSDTSESAYNKIRALNPEPGTYLVIDRKDKKMKLKILEAQPQISQEVEPLTRGLSIKNGLPVMGFKNGGLLLQTVQPEGKKLMSGQDFARGYGKMLQLSHV